MGAPLNWTVASPRFLGALWLPRLEQRSDLTFRDGRTVVAHPPVWDFLHSEELRCWEGMGIQCRAVGRSLRSGSLNCQGNLSILGAPAAWPPAHRSCGPGAGWPHSFESHGCKGAGHERVGACVLGRDAGVVRVVGRFGVWVSSQGFERRPEGFSSSVRTVSCWAAPLSSVVSQENDSKVLNGGGHQEAPFSGSVSTEAGHEGH